MILIVCIDEKNGMLFNNRRQSKDRNLIEHILKKIDSKKLWITDFSRDLFLIKPFPDLGLNTNNKFFSPIFLTSTWLKILLESYLLLLLIYEVCD